MAKKRKPGRPPKGEMSLVKSRDRCFVNITKWAKILGWNYEKKPVDVVRPYISDYVDEDHKRKRPSPALVIVNPANRTPQIRQYPALVSLTGSMPQVTVYTDSGYGGGHREAYFTIDPKSLSSNEAFLYSEWQKCMKMISTFRNSPYFKRAFKRFQKGRKVDKTIEAMRVRRKEREANKGDQAQK